MFCNLCDTRIEASIDGELICRQCYATREDVCEVCDGLGQVKEYPQSLFTGKAWTWIPCPSCAKGEAF